MYNLLVRYTAWSQEGRDTIGLERVFEKTPDHLMDRFRPHGILDTDALKELPTLFVTEIRSTDPRVFRLGRITSLRVRTKDIVLGYEFDDGIPEMPTEVLNDHLDELDIESESELSRGHWAIKEADLSSASLFQSNWSRTQFAEKSYGNAEASPSSASSQNSTSPDPTSRRILLSHADSDSAMASSLARLIEISCGLQRAQILCTSSPAYGLRAGEEWIDALRSVIRDGDLIVFLISEAFLASDFCGFELGAAWIVKDERQRFPMLLPRVEASRLNALPGSWHCPTISEEALASLVDRVVELCELKPPPASDVTIEVQAFMSDHLR